MLQKKIRIVIWTFLFEIYFQNQFSTSGSGQNEIGKYAYLRIFTVTTSQSQKLILKADFK